MMLNMDRTYDVNEAKLLLRKESRRWRDTLSEAHVLSGSARIQENLKGLDVFRDAAQVLTYVDTYKEVKTQPIMAELLASGRAVLVPVMQDGGLLLWSRVHTMGDLVENSFGILEPKNPEFVSPIRDSCCLVPGLAFMVDGHRIGYGKGFYDRFLSKYSGVSVGICFEAQVQDAIPMGKYDQKVDIIATENRLVSVD